MQILGKKKYASIIIEYLVILMLCLLKICEIHTKNL